MRFLCIIIQRHLPNSKRLTTARVSTSNNSSANIQGFIKMSPTPLPPPQQPSPQRPSTMAAVTQDAINSMKNFAKQIQLKGVPGLINEFNRIPSNVTEAEHKVCTDNPTLNRYTNIVCLDSTRVHLNWPPGTKNDYIHANWIGGFPELDKRLIATQAPLEKTIGDFWRMIWQEKAVVIVMLCQFVEEGKRKADKYWPSRAMEKIYAGGLAIENRFVDEQQDKQMRISTLVVKGRNPRTGEIREHVVTHVLWRGWPDRDVPASATNALQLLFKIGGGVPSGGVVVVHCSAGIGRTGTIIALEIALRKLLAGRELNIQGIVTKLREQRYKACQTYTQYLYIHFALLAWIALKHPAIVSIEDFAAFREEYMKARKE